MEKVKAVSRGPVWYQLYFMGGREASEFAIERVSKAGFSALVVTVDTAVAGLRERDLRNGMKELLSILFRTSSLPSQHPGASSAGSLSFLSGRRRTEARKRCRAQRRPHETHRRRCMALRPRGNHVGGSGLDTPDFWKGHIIVKGVLISVTMENAPPMEGAAAVRCVRIMAGGQLDRRVFYRYGALPEVVRCL